MNQNWFSKYFDTIAIILLLYHQISALILLLAIYNTTVTNITSLFDNINFCNPNSKDSYHTLLSNDPQCRNIISKDKSNTQANMQSESLKIICPNCQSIIGKKKYFGNC